HRRLDQYTRELELAPRLEGIRLKGYARVGGVLDFAPADQEYEDAFRQAGFGQPHDDPQAVAARVKESSISNPLLAALDHWVTCTRAPLRKSWLLKVAAHADTDATGWRGRARDPETRKDEAAFARLLDTAPLAELSPALLMALAHDWNARGKDCLPF